MSLMKVVICEDEERSRNMLLKMIEMFCPEVTVAGVADSVATGVKVINEVRPDIVLMDIELRPGKCFEIFPQLDALDFEVIFTTAYKDYAIEAIKYGALDYLLKPININELSLAITKVGRKRKGRTEENAALKKFLNDYRPASVQRLSLHTTDGIAYVAIGDIVRCEAKGPYTIIYTKNGDKHMTSKNLKEYETMLHDHFFFRVHNSHLVNLLEVVKYKNIDGGMVEMKNGEDVPVAHRRKDDFLEQMKMVSVNMQTDK